MISKDIIKVAVNLVIIYLVGGLLLAAVYATTSPVIFKKTKEEKERALKEMMPGVESIVKAGSWEPQHKHGDYYEGKNGEELQGYVVETYGKGYSSYINVLVAADKDLVVKKIKILHHAETPGLGDEIEKDYFKGQFEGKDIDHLVLLKTETTDMIQAISGATISSRAVTNGVKDGMALLKEKYGAKIGTEAGAAQAATPSEGGAASAHGEAK